jgi:hypothetical protein
MAIYNGYNTLYSDIENLVKNSITAGMRNGNASQIETEFFWIAPLISKINAIAPSIEPAKISQNAIGTILKATSTYQEISNTVTITAVILPANICAGVKSITSLLYSISFSISRPFAVKRREI